MEMETKIKIKMKNNRNRIGLITVVIVGWLSGKSTLIFSSYFLFVPFCFVFSSIFFASLSVLWVHFFFNWSLTTRKRSRKSHRLALRKRKKRQVQRKKVERIRKKNQDQNQNQDQMNVKNIKSLLTAGLCTHTHTRVSFESRWRRRRR